MFTRWLRNRSASIGEGTHPRRARFTAIGCCYPWGQYPAGGADDPRSYDSFPVAARRRRDYRRCIQAPSTTAFAQCSIAPICDAYGGGSRAGCDAHWLAWPGAAACCIADPSGAPLRRTKNSLVVVAATDRLRLARPRWFVLAIGRGKHCGAGCTRTNKETRADTPWQPYHPAEETGHSYRRKLFA